MLVLDNQLVCANDGCSRRFNLGWGGLCDECTALSEDHISGMHTEPLPDCRDCF
jgi:hypothetical protein